MDLGRMASHAWRQSGRLRRCFPVESLASLEQAIQLAGATHDGQIRFVVEGGLSAQQVRQGMQARERALELFALLRVWDTERNNGVLIYVLLADRAVEILADRHIHALAGSHAWQAIAQRMQEGFKQGRFQQAALDGIRGVAAQLGATSIALPQR